MDMTKMWYIYDTHDYFNNIVHIYNFDGRVKICSKELKTMLDSDENYNFF
jgi:calcineurin-like phosphoesterase family protein